MRGTSRSIYNTSKCYHRSGIVIAASWIIKTPMHTPSSSYFDRSAVLHKKTFETECEMADIHGQHAAGNYNYDARGSILHELGET